MKVVKNVSVLLWWFHKYKFPIHCFSSQRFSHSRNPFAELYHKTTGEELVENCIPILKKKHPNIHTLTHENLQCTLNILEKFNITSFEACQNPHVFSMNPITMDNYAEILKECGFINILPIHIIRYHTLVRSRTIENLKKNGLLRNEYVLEEVLQNSFLEWPSEHKSLEKFSDSNTSILTVRMSVLEKYLHWRLSVTEEEFKKYCRHYLPLKHKPMADIREALDIALNEIMFDEASIRRNGFIISSDPVKTKMLLENVPQLAGLDIREAVKTEPAILKSNYTAVLHIRNILEEYRISEEAQRRYLKVYCMKPTTVQQRLDELKALKEYQVLSTNPRVLSMVIHKNKMISRLCKIQEAKKQCYSLNNLVASNKVFNSYISGFGNKGCGRDLAMLISSSVKVNDDTAKSNDSQLTRDVIKQLKRHKYSLHAALNVVDENIQYLKKRFENNVIFNHCQLLLYPISEIEYYLNYLLDLRSGNVKKSEHSNVLLDASYNNLQCHQLTDNQILSLVLYEIEKKYHFSGDGIWAKQDGLRTEARAT